MKILSLEEAFIHELSDICNAEKQITRSLPRMIRAATNPKLKSGFEAHLADTEGQLNNIEQFCKANAIKLKRIKCKAMEGLNDEMKEIISQIEKGPVRDVLLIGGAQKVEHYEIATYGCLILMAKKLGMKKIDLLVEILEQEKACDKELTRIATAKVNDDALKYHAA